MHRRGHLSLFLRETWTAAQDFKLDVLCWQHLPALGSLAAWLASRIGASGYLDHYQRDLGLGAVSPVPIAGGASFVA